MGKWMNGRTPCSVVRCVLGKWGRKQNFETAAAFLFTFLLLLTSSRCRPLHTSCVVVACFYLPSRDWCTWHERMPLPMLISCLVLFPSSPSLHPRASTGGLSQSLHNVQVIPRRVRIALGLTFAEKGGIPCGNILRQVVADLWAAGMLLPSPCLAWNPAFFAENLDA